MGPADRLNQIRAKLPKWIKYDKAKDTFKVSFEPLVCENKTCGANWYPRIRRDGTVEIPTVCPDCHSHVWWKKKE